MALKPFQLFSLIIFLFLISFSHIACHTPSDKKSSPFDFIKNLQGFRKGNNTENIHQLKAYLKAFGYLEHHANEDDDFDETLELALKTYQENYRIEPTGALDAATISQMTLPRCGVPDIVNGTNYMQLHKRKHDPSGIHTVSRFQFFPGNPRWPPSKTHLTYKFLPNFPSNFMAPVDRAFQTWDSATHFTFARAQNNQNADLTIGIFRGDHGDGGPFDGRGGVLAHAFAPTKGQLHFDADERWSDKAIPDAMNLGSTALHEIGHLLGLGHSSVKEAIMFPTIKLGQIKNILQEDDIQGIRSLYNR